MTTIRVVLAMCATYDLHLDQLDVKTAFLHENLEEEIYMLQPEGFEQKGKENLICRLNKSLYDLKQAPRCWYKRFDPFIRSLEYNRLHADTCLNKDRINKLKAQLAREFEMKDLGPANKIMWMQIHQDRISKKIWLSQKSYLKKILQRFNMQDCKSISTPFPTNLKLSSKMSPSSKEERMEMSRVSYASAVGSLMFVMICTRPDIAYAVGVVSRYMAEPGKEHWEDVKRILRYIKGTSDVALYFVELDLIVKGYVDSDYACDLDGSKSTTGYVFTLSGGTVSWVLKLLSVVAMSTIEAEYVAVAQASKEAVWLKMLLEELGHEQEKITLFYDNQSALYLARNPTFHSKTKHIRVQYHFVHEKAEEGTVDMRKIHTDDNVTDYLTKEIKYDSDLRLTPVVRPRNNPHIVPEITTTTQTLFLSQNNQVDNYVVKPIWIIPCPAGIVQMAKLRKIADTREGGEKSVMSTQEYIIKVIEDVGEDDDFTPASWLSVLEYVNVDGGIVTGCFGDVKKFLKNGKLDKVVGVIKSFTPNAMCDLTVTLKNLSGTISGTIH
ncbi:retrovirus-related pol polyprotein from transposon TNT 1-94 [Tanacetum coccineum]